MHPILGHRGRLLIYLLPWLVAGLALTWLMVATAEVRVTVAAALAVPLALIYAFICLAAWYPSRSAPLRGASLWPALASHATAAPLSAAMWLLAGGGWAWLLGRSRAFPEAETVFAAQSALVFALGLLLYLLAATGSYLYLAFEESYASEKRALEARRRQELAEQEVELARELQRRLLPAPELDGDRFRLSARNLAARGVAGDFYDYFQLPDGRLRIAVADVAGKGMAASLIMATVKAILPLVAEERSVVETMRELNRRLAADLAPREFVALALAGFDPETGRLELANAGLPDPYVLTADGDVRPLEVAMPRLPLGVRREVDYGSAEAELAPGDRLVMLTDGLPEAPDQNGEPIGYEALEELLAAAGPGDAPGPWLDALLERLQDVTKGRLGDDWTALALDRSP
ncbi:MAG: PP2C family protein-serine/threonine phosphatase [Acidobacteriota bacterium]